MRGITDTDLIEIFEAIFNRYFKLEDAEGLLKRRVRELNPWKPIETAPEGRPLRLFVKKTPLVASYQTDGCITESNRYQYSHWQELPEDPK